MMNAKRPRGPLTGRRLTVEEVPEKWRSFVGTPPEGCGPDDCWLMPRPYHEVTWYRDGKQISHRIGRVVVAVKRGVIEAGTEAMHSCDNPRCRNPGHLDQGTHAANMTDMASKGRANTRVDPARSSAAMLNAYAEGKRQLHLAGANHPRAREVIAPDGRRWPCSRGAGADLGVSGSAVRGWCRGAKDGWAFGPKKQERCPLDFEPKNAGKLVVTKGCAFEIGRWYAGRRFLGWSPSSNAGVRYQDAEGYIFTTILPTWVKWTASGDAVAA